jgi:AcrR family transcriptional regulator
MVHSSSRVLFVGTARRELLGRLIAEVGERGLGDRSLRDLAAAVGSSHRMLHYHFGSREGLVAALVHAVEESQRALLQELAAEIGDPGELMRALWRRVAAPELRPFVRLFFECVAATGGEGLTEPWLGLGPELAAVLGEEVDAVDLRIGVALTRGLLIEVLASGDTAAGDAAIERYLALREPHAERR